jgi:hypothetical protein
MRRFCLYLVVATAGLAGSAQIAAAKTPRLRPVQVTTTLEDAPGLQQTEWDGLNCPTDRALLGGGFDAFVNGYFLAAVGTYPIDSGPNPGSDTYRTVMDAFGPEPSYDITSMNICAKVDGLQERSAFADSQEGQTTTVDATCENNEHVTGGGGFGEGPYETQRMTASVPFDGDDGDSKPDDGWRVTVENLTEFDDYEVTAFAICSKGLRGLAYEHEKGSAKPFDWDLTDVKCPDGQKVIAGGLEIGSHPFGDALFFRNMPLAASKTVWESGVTNDDGATKVHSTTYAICHR